MIRSGSREQKKKMLPGGSGSGDLDDATEALMGLPTILYPDPTPTAAAAATTGSADNITTSTHILVLLQYNDLSTGKIRGN